jgi:hypothetical protein
MRATNSPSTCGMHHMSLRQGLSSFSAKRRRTVSRQTLSCSVSLTSSSASSSSVQRARPSGGFEQAVATSRASSLPESLRSAPGRGSSLRRLQVANHEAALGPIDGRAAYPDAPRDLLVADAGIRSQQNLCTRQLARRVPAAAEVRLSSSRQFG